MDKLRLSKFCLVAIFLYFITALSPQAHAEVNSSVITVSTLGDSSVYSFIDNKTGKPTGFFIDVMDEIAKRGGFSVTYKIQKNWADMVSTVQNGKADLALGLAVTEERKQILAFTSSIDTSTISSFVRASNHSDKPLDKAKRVGIRTGSFTGTIIRNKYPDIEIKSYDSYSDGLFDLLAGHIDALCASTSVIIKLSKESGIEDKIKVDENPIYEYSSALAIQKSNTLLLSKLNLIIDELTHSAEYKRIYNKWHVNPTPYWTIKRIAIVGSIIGTLLVIVLLVWRHVSLINLNNILAESENSFKTLFEQSADAIILVALPGIIMDANHVALERYKYTREEFIGMDIQKLYSPDDRPNVKARIEKLVNDGLIAFEGKHLTKDGIVIPTEVSARLVCMRGTHLSISSCRDITERKKLETEKNNLINQLKEALEEVKVLSGLLPICCSCKNIRDDQGYWNRIENYISEHSEAEFTHSICPECMKKLYPDLCDEILEENDKAS